MGRKLVSDSTSHAVVAVAMRVRDGSLEALVRRVGRHAGEGLAEALARAVDVGALAHVEQLETRVLGDGTLATVYLGLARPSAELGAGWRPAGSGPPDERELVERELLERVPPLRGELFVALVLRVEEERLLEPVGALSATAALILSKSFSTDLFAFLASRCKFFSALVTSL